MYAIRSYYVLDTRLGLLSVAALVPAVAGLALGQALRRRMPEQLFRKVFFAALLALGGYIIARAV